MQAYQLAPSKLIDQARCAHGVHQMIPRNALALVPCGFAKIHSAQILLHFCRHWRRSWGCQKAFGYGTACLGGCKSVARRPMRASRVCERRSVHSVMRTARSTTCMQQSCIQALLAVSYNVMVLCMRSCVYPTHVLVEMPAHSCVPMLMAALPVPV